MLTLAFSSSRRHFLKAVGVLGANLTALVVLVKCKTVGPAAELLDDAGADPGFMAMSRGLTGHDVLDGSLGQNFHNDLKLQFGEEKVAKLLTTYSDAASSGDDADAQIKAKIMDDDELGKVAVAAIGLWYGGTFAKLQVAQPIAVKAYQKSLVWKMFSGGKPMGVPADEESGWAIKPADEV
jgi:hypothetical protein